MNELLLKMITENPDSMVEVTKEYIEKYKPAVYAICKEALEIMKDYAENKEICEVVAIRKKNQFDAYVSVGFTEEQAIAFILNDNLQLVKSMKEINNSTKNSTKK